MASPRRARRGNYAVLMSFLLTSVLGAGALVVDWSRARIAGAEAQAIADAAAQAGVIALRSTGSETEAREAAELVVSRNTIAGAVPDLLSFEVGAWSNTTRSWTSGGSNAVNVTVGRTGDAALSVPLARLFGMPDVEISRTATAATATLEAVLVMDITASWDKEDFNNCRAAALGFIDLLHNAHSTDDVIGMAVFLQRFGWEFTPFTNIHSSSRDPSLVRNKWAALNIGSLPGRYNASYEPIVSKQYACDVYSTNNFSSPPGGCWANMPRYYLDEGGTDHTTGMEMARTMFRERTDPYAYRAMIVLTDGKPVGYTSSAGSARTSAGYTERRFREYKRSGGHSQAAIEADAVSLANRMYEEDHVNIWFVSFVQYRAFMESASQGDGYFDLAATSAEIVDIFAQIGRSLPVTVVQ